MINRLKKLTVIALTGVILVSGITPVTAEAKSGLVTSEGYTYYYKNNSKVKNTSKTVNGKKYYFSSKGRGFLSTGSSNGNKAVADVLDHVSFSASSSRGQKLRKVYDYIIAKYKYTPAETPDLSASSWVGKSAYNMVKYGDAKCYNYAALTGLCARALGYNAKIVTGKANRSRGRKKSEHAWVLIGDRVLDTCYDAVNGKSGDQYYYKTYRQIKRSEGSSYSADKRF